MKKIALTVGVALVIGVLAKTLSTTALVATLGAAMTVAVTALTVSILIECLRSR